VVALVTTLVVTRLGPSTWTTYHGVRHLALRVAIHLGVAAPLWLLVAGLTLTLHRRSGRGRGLWLAVLFAGLAAATAFLTELWSPYAVVRDAPRMGVTPAPLSWHLLVPIACHLAAIGWMVATSLALARTSTWLDAGEPSPGARRVTEVLRTVPLAALVALIVFLTNHPDAAYGVLGLAALALVFAQLALARLLADRAPLPTATVVPALR
jgi:hypothetical protein